MRASAKYILEMTTEIVKSRLSNISVPLDENSGKETADYIQKVYDKISEISKTAMDDFE